MDKTLRVLLRIEKEPDISQRQLAKSTGYSLGSVNGILQKLIDEEEIVSKPLTPNHYVYEITPAGHIHKAKLLYDFTLDGYDVIARIRRQTKEAISRAVNEGILHFYLYGEEDALYRLVKMSMIEYKRKAGIDYTYITSLEEVDKSINYQIFLWNKETLELPGKTVNVLLGK